MHAWAFFWLIIILRKSWWGGTRPWNVSFATPPNNAQVQFLPFTYSQKNLSLTTLYTKITSMNNHIDDEHENIVIKYKLHYRQEGKPIGFGCQKNKKRKGVAPFFVTNFLATNNLTKALIQQIHFIEYYSTWCFHMLLFILESPSRPWSKVWHPNLDKKVRSCQ